MRPMRLVARIATRTTTTWLRYGRKKAAMRRSVRPRRSLRHRRELGCAGSHPTIASTARSVRPSPAADQRRRLCAARGAPPRGNPCGAGPYQAVAVAPLR